MDFGTEEKMFKNAKPFTLLIQKFQTGKQGFK